MREQVAMRARETGAARTLSDAVAGMGEGWWQLFGGRQLSPVSAGDGRPLPGASRVILALATAEFGCDDRRWGTEGEFEALGYRPRRGEQPVVVPHAQGGGRLGSACATLLNACQVASVRGAGLRHGSPMPPEVASPKATVPEANTVACAALALAGGRAIVGRETRRWRTRDLKSLLEASALSLIRDSGNAGESLATLALTATLAAAFSLSDLGIAPAKACGRHAAARPVTLSWAEEVREDPGLLSRCAQAAEPLAARIETAVWQARPRLQQASGSAPSRPNPVNAPSSEAAGRVGAAPSPAEGPRHEGHPDKAGYSLRSVAEESRAASATLSQIARTRGMP